MRLTLRFMPALALAIVCMGAAAQAALITGPWTNAVGQGDGPITGVGPGTVTVGNNTSGSANGEMISSLFPSIVLADGDKITFTGNVVLTGTVGSAAGPRTQFRFGLFQGDGDDLGWPGYYLQNSSGTGTPQGTLSRKPVGNTSAYLSGTGSNSLIATMGNGVIFNDNTYAMNLTLERSGASLLVSGTLTGATNGFVQSLSTTDATASTQGSFSFDRLGFLLGANLSTDQAQFSQLDVTYTPIPEPATCMLALVSIIGTAVMRRRVC